MNETAMPSLLFAALCCCLFFSGVLLALMSHYAPQVFVNSDNAEEATTTTTTKTTAAATTAFSCKFLCSANSLNSRIAELGQLFVRLDIVNQLRVCHVEVFSRI